jgi:hypothetical protein
MVWKKTSSARLSTAPASLYCPSVPSLPVPLFVCLSVRFLFLCSSLRPSTVLCPSIRLSVRFLFLCSSLRPSTVLCPSTVPLFVCLSVSCLCVSQSVRLLPLCSSVRPSTVPLFVCLSVHCLLTRRYGAVRCGPPNTSRHSKTD